MADISKIQTGANGTVYNIVDASAVHTVDSSLSSSSENPVQNKVIKSALDGKKDVVNLGSLTANSLGTDTYTISGIASADVTKINAMSAPYDVAFSTTIDSTSYVFNGSYDCDETINGGTYHLYSGTMSDGHDDAVSFVFGVLSTGTTGLLSLVEYVEFGDLATVATTGSYTDLTNTPTIPTDYIHDGNYTTAQYRKGGLVIGASNSSEAGGINVQNGRIYVTGNSNPLFGLKSSDSGATQFFLQVTKDHMYVGPTSSNALDFASTGITTMPNNLIVKGNIIKYGGTSSQFLKADGSVDSTVYSTFSGNYNDLTNKPTIPTQTSQLTNNGSDGTSTYIEASDLATVATTGDYNDLLNKPENELFKCEYNVTTPEEITEALHADKLPYLEINGEFYQYYYGSSMNGYKFVCTTPNVELKWVSVDGRGWSSATTITLENTTHKVTSISASSTNTQYPSALAVYNAISSLPTPMQFKGTVGTGGTIEWANLPNVSTSTGYTYKVITDHSTAPICKVGDTIISNGSTWVVIPSGDEPVGVQSIGFTQGDGIVLTVTPDNPITSSGTVTVEHEDTSSQASVSNSGRTYIQSVTLDTFGHVTGLSSATETVTDDHKVTQVAVPSGTPEPTASPYNVLIGYSEGGSAETNYVRKSAITYNQTTKALSTGGEINGYTLNAASAKAVDTSISAASTSTNLPTSQAVASFVEGKGYVTTDTTYEFTDGVNGFTVTPSVNGVAGQSIPVTVTPSITNNVTGSGTSTHVPRWTGTNTIGDTTVVIDNNNNIVTSKAIVLSGISSSISTSDSKIYFGSSTSNYYSYLSSNTSGAFSFGASGGAITVYPNTGTYNCMMTNCGSDLGRSDADGSKAWNNLYLKGGIYKYSGGTHYKQELQNKAGTIALTSDIPSAPGTLNTTATTAQATNASEALSGSITLHKVAKTGDYGDLLNKPTIPTTYSDVDAQQEPLVGQINDNTASDYLTPAQVYAAVAAGRQVFASATYQSAPLVFTNFNSGVDIMSGNVLVAANVCVNLLMVGVIGDVAGGSWRANLNFLVDDTIYGQIPTQTSQLTNDSGYITGSDVPTYETDPTVPSWAKEPTKPTYTAAEVGALPDSTTIPTQTSDLTNDGSDGTSTYVETNEFTTVTASKATAGTAVSCYKSGGVVSQTSYTSGVGFTVAEGTVTATSVYTGGGTVSQTSYSSESITPYTFADVTALAWAT